MLTQEENELLTRVGPGTPMGELMRQYWIPALLASELPEPDGAPRRIRLLCENLIAFRTTSGAVGLIQDACMHRGASLFFGRNEEDGLRCVYHGWKYDVSGQCVDMPNEPAESDFKAKIRATAYPCVERNGIIWTYMGPRRAALSPTLPRGGRGLDGLPALPDIEPNMLADGQWSVNATLRECNFFQGLEGDIDTSHAQFLHHGSVRTTDVRPGTFMHYRMQDRAPKYAVVDTDFGTMYGAYRPAEEDSNYWRIACFMLPFYTIVPVGLLGHQVSVRCWVPLDDENMMFISMSKRGASGANIQANTRVRDPSAQNQQSQYRPDTSDWLGRFHLVPDRTNDYLIDREVQKQGISYTGINGVGLQDQAITESEGRIYSRVNEHLGSSDAMIVRSRKRLIDAAKALRDHGVTPPGADDPNVYRVRGGGVILPANADWLAATEKWREAFVDHPDLDPSIVG